MNTAKTYTIEKRMYEEVWFSCFSYNAKNEKDAENKLYGWTRHHGMSTNDTRIRPATEEEIKYRVHDEYVKWY